MSPFARLHAHWKTMPLSARMVALIVFLMTVALCMVGAVMINTLHRQLMRQVDDQLIASAQRLQDDALSGISSFRTITFPMDYYLRREASDQQPQALIAQQTKDRAGVPIIPEMLDSGLELAPGTITPPATVSSTRLGSQWRMTAAALPMTGAGTQTVITVALPLQGVKATLANTAAWFALAGLSIILSGGVLGHYLVSRSLRPLRQIESVAEKIAAGDLSRRIPPGPPGTEVGSLANSLNGMLTQIENSFSARDESEQKVRRFVSDASHELRTPLAAIRGYGELYRMGGVPPEKVGDVMERIESESTRMGNLVEDLLILARLDEKRPLQLAEVNLVRLAREAASDLEALDPTRPVKVLGLTARKPPTEVAVRADRDQLTQVTVNLVGNIARYTPASSPVEILVGEENGWGTICFRDHGPGIDPEEQDRVFERFYRTDQSRARSLGGSGLGLSIVASIIEAHNGTVRLSPTRKGGLTVRLQFPLW